MPKRRHEALELGDGSRHKKLKTNENDKGKLVSKNNPVNAVAIQPKSNKQSMKVVNEKANSKSSHRASKIEKKKNRKQHGKERMVNAQKSDGEPRRSVDVQGSQQKSKKLKKERKNHTKASWKVSEITGGRMLDLDPIFSLNEEYVDCPHR